MNSREETSMGKVVNTEDIFLGERKLFSPAQIAEIMNSTVEISIAPVEKSEGKCLEARKHICPICQKGFTKIGYLTRHFQTHSGNKPFQCQICNNQFNRKAHLIRHELIHYEAKLFKCNFCNKDFKRKEHLNRHSAIHSDIKPFVCSTCFKQFRFKSNLIVHKRIHSGDKPYECEVCQKLFTQKRSLTEHLLIHLGGKLFCCPTCQKNFIRKRDLDRHIRGIHLNERPFVCDTCQRGFIQKSDLVIHTRIHSGERNFRCTTCNKAYTSKCNLNSHLKVHLNKQGKVSKKKKSRKAKLKEHLQENYVKSNIETVHDKLTVDGTQQCSSEGSFDKKLVEDVPLERNQSFCAILGCHNQKNTKPPVFIHPFPQDEEKRELWVQMTGRKNFKPQPSSFVCGKHFDSSDYSKDKHTLNATAVPSLHLHLPDGVMQIEYIEDIDEEGFQILMNGNAKTSNEKKRKNSEEINHNWKIPKPNEQESRVAMEKFRELYTTQEMVAMKIMRYKQDLKKYARVCSEADELKAVLKKRRQSQQDDKSKLLNILDGISKKEPIDENLDSTSQKDTSAEQILKSDEELIEMLPTRYTEAVKKFASKLYTFNPDAYVYLRHTLRTLLPDVDYLRSLAKTGFKAPPAEKVTAIKVTTEMSEDCMNLKIQTD